MYITEAFVPYAAEMLALVKTHTGISDWSARWHRHLRTGTEYLDEPAVALMTCALANHYVFSGKEPPPRLGSRTPTAPMPPTSPSSTPTRTRRTSKN